MNPTIRHLPLITLVAVLAPMIALAENSSNLQNSKTPRSESNLDSASSAPLRLRVKNTDWSLPRGARIEGDRLIAEIPAEEGPRNIWCAAKIPVAEALAAMKCVAAHVRYRAAPALRVTVSSPKSPPRRGRATSGARRRSPSPRHLPR